MNGTLTEPDRRREARWLAEVAGRVRGAVRGRYAPDTCILTAAALLDVLTQAGIVAHPLTCGVMVVNRAYGERVEREGRFPQGREEVARWQAECGAHSVGVGYGLDPIKVRPGWDGHLVVVATDREGRRYLVDAALDQCDRPQHAIVAGIVVADAPARWLAGREPLLVRLAEGLARYEARRRDTSYTASKDWAEPVRRARVVADALRLAQQEGAGR